MDIQKLNTTLRDIDEPYVVILIGPPLSGKDTVINKLKGLDFEMISRDQLLLDVHGSDDYTAAFKEANQKQVDKLLRQAMVDGGNSDGNIILNMTHMGRKRRKHNLSFFPNHYKVGVIFPILEDEEYARRNTKRDAEENKFIPTFVIKRMVSQYQTISDDEGFDKVISL